MSSYRTRGAWYLRPARFAEPSEPKLKSFARFCTRCGERCLEHPTAPPRHQVVCPTHGSRRDSQWRVEEIQSPRTTS
jgi:hypothetical protein